MAKKLTKEMYDKIFGDIVKYSEKTILKMFINAKKDIDKLKAKLKKKGIRLTAKEREQLIDDYWDVLKSDIEDII